MRHPLSFDAVLSDAGIRTVRSAVRAPRMNAGPHMALASSAPDKPLAPEATDLDAFRMRKHDRAGGVVQEYHRAA
jgi:hypothetical protein